MPDSFYIDITGVSSVVIAVSGLLAILGVYWSRELKTKYTEREKGLLMTGLYLLERVYDDEQLVDPEILERLDNKPTSYAELGRLMNKIDGVSNASVSHSNAVRIIKERRARISDQSSQNLSQR